MTLKELLMNDSSWYQVYKFLPWTNAKELSKMVLLSMIIDADSFVSERLKEDYSYFMCTNRLLRKTYGAGWSKNTLNNYFNELRKDGFIDIRLIKYPNYTHAPRYVKINNQKLIETYSLYKGQNLTDNSQNLTDNVQNLFLNNNNQQEPYNNNTSSIEEDSTPPEGVLETQESNIYKGAQRPPKNVFIVPTIEEVNEFVRKENLSSVDVDYFYKHYELSDWRDKGGNLINWKQTLLKWNKIDEDNKPKKKIKKIEREE